MHVTSSTHTLYLVHMYVHTFVLILTGLKVVTWDLEVSSSPNTYTVTIRDPPIPDPTITVTQGTTASPNIYFSIVLGLAGADAYIYFIIDRILGQTCTDACSLFHENTAYTTASNTTEFLDFTWGVSDGTIRTIASGPDKTTAMIVVFQNKPMDGLWKFRTACLAPLSGQCPKQP